MAEAANTSALRGAHGVSPWRDALTPGRHGRSGSGAGLWIAPVLNRSVAGVIARHGQVAAVGRTLAVVTGVPTPSPRHFSSNDTTIVAFDGPGRYVVRQDGDAGGDLVQALRGALAQSGSVTDQSHGAAILRFGGPKAIETLMRGTSLDVEADFPAGSAALVSLGHMSAHLMRLDDAPTFEVQVFRSMARSFATWLIDSGAQFGVDVRG